MDKTYDFDYQEMRLLSPEVKLKSGDSLRQECTYSSAARRTFTEVRKVDLFNTMKKLLTSFYLHKLRQTV